MNRLWKDSEIANWAEGVRRYLGIAPKDRIDVFRLMHKLSSESDAKLKITFQVVPPLRLPNSLAEAEPVNRLVRYRQSVHTGILNAEPSAGQVMLEEIAHIFLHGHRKALNHFSGRDFRAANVSEVEREEREAKKFTWYALAPIAEVYSVKDGRALVEKFAMSPEMAEEYFQHIHRTRSQVERLPRALPPGVSDFLEYRRSRIERVADHLPSSKFAVIQAQQNTVVLQPPRQINTLRGHYQSSQIRSSYLLCPECGHDMKMNGANCAVCQTCGYQEGCD